MSVIHLHDQTHYPAWSEINHYGINYLKIGQQVVPHYHDCNEYWIIVSGRGICTTEGDTYELEPGDIVMTKAGDEHSLVVTEEMVAVYIYGILPPGGTVGYRYHNKHDE